MLAMLERATATRSRLLRCAVLIGLVGACIGNAWAAAGDPLTGWFLQAPTPPLLLLGEVHDNAGQHALRQQALEALLQGGARPALLMEQFDRERQADIDQARARPGADADAVIAAASSAQSRWQWAFYKPFIALALRHGLPIVAANVSRADTRRVMSEGLLAMDFEGRVPPDITAVQAASIVAGHCGAVDAALGQRMASAQVARDQFMARMVERHAARGVVLLAGNGHVRRDIGVPRWLGPELARRTRSFGLLEQGDPDTPAYDHVVVTPPQPREDPCTAMRPAEEPKAAPAR